MTNLMSSKVSHGTAMGILIELIEIILIRFVVHKLYLMIFSKERTKAKGVYIQYVYFFLILQRYAYFFPILIGNNYFSLQFVEKLSAA